MTESPRPGLAKTEPPISTLLSQALVAFTIELDNEGEQRMAHRTTSPSARKGTSGTPWLTSSLMWWNCLRFVEQRGISVGELERRARTTTNLAGMKRWGYVTVAPDAGPDAIVRATPAGRRAREVWPPLFALIEQRWRARFGEGEIDELRASLTAVAARLDLALPDCMPILRYGLWSIGRRPGKVSFRPLCAGGDAEDIAALALPALLSRVLLVFAIDFERGSKVSLAISANLLSMLDEQGTRVRDLPALTGVSKEAIAMGMGVLGKRELLTVEPDPGGERWKLARLTPKGQRSREVHRRLQLAVERGWQPRFGRERIHALRAALQRLAGEPGTESPALLRGLEPYPDGWRASVRAPQTLPHFPMVLHRGGYPDGS